MSKENKGLSATFTHEELEQFRVACEFIADASPAQAAMLVNEVMMHYNILCFNEHTRSLDSIKLVDVNGMCIQLTTGGN